MAEFRYPDGSVRVARVQMVDESAGGYGVLSPLGGAVGSEIVVRPETGSPGVRGTIVRWTETENGHRLGIRRAARGLAA